MVWSDEKDFVMLKEVAGEGVFNSKPGSRERDGSWQVVANIARNLGQNGGRACALRR